MKRFLFVLGLGLVAAGLSLATPAQAVEIPACPPGEFTLFAKKQIALEQGNSNIQGNLLVSGPDGLVKVGNHVKIDGRVIAHQIKLGTGAVVKECVADDISGDGTCTTVIDTFANFVAANPVCLAYPLTDPVVVDACVDTATPSPFIVSTSGPLAPGCYGALKVQDKVIVTLAEGTYNFKSMFLGAESQLLGPNNTVPPGDPPGTTINTKGSFGTEQGVILTNVLLNSAQSVGELHIFNGSTLTNVVFNAPDAKIHIHTAAKMTCSELVGEILDIEPITAVCVPETICACPDGFKFVQDPQTDPSLDRRCCRIAPGSPDSCPTPP